MATHTWRIFLPVDTREAAPVEFVRIDRGPEAPKKTTPEIPVGAWRCAKFVAAQRGVAPRAFITEVIEEKWACASAKGENLWARLAL